MAFPGVTKVAGLVWLNMCELLKVSVCVLFLVLVLVYMLNLLHGVQKFQ